MFSLLKTWFLNKFSFSPFFLTKLLTNLVNKKDLNIKFSIKMYKKGENMKKYLLLVEDEKMWDKFKELIEKDINTEIISLIQKRIKKEENGK